MELNTAIFTRQSVSKVLADEVPRGLIEELLQAAAQAPNHHRVWPWRFVVLTGTARERMGEVMARSLLRRDPAASAAALEAESKRPLRAPVLIAVGIDRPESEKISEVENICAGAAAVQNLLLAAHARGLGAVWRTGPAAVDTTLKEFLGFQPEQHLIAIIYLGRMAGDPPAIDRPGFEDRTRWLDE